MVGKTKQPASSPKENTKKSGRPSVSRGVQTHADEAAATALSRDALSRERYEFLLKMIYVLLGILALSIAANVWLGSRPVEYRYFATDPQGGIRELSALNRPIQSSHEVLNWVTEVVTKSYSMSFANYAQQLSDIKSNFTDAGWRGYEQALERGGFIERLLSQQYVTTAVPNQAPVIVAEGLVNGVYGWRLQVPLTVTFQSASANTSQTIQVEVTVVRRPETENPKGLGIAQIVTK